MSHLQALEVECGGVRDDAPHDHVQQLHVALRLALRQACAAPCLGVAGGAALLVVVVVLLILCLVVVVVACGAGGKGNARVCRWPKHLHLGRGGILLLPPCPHPRRALGARPDKRRTDVSSPSPLRRPPPPSTAPGPAPGTSSPRKKSSSSCAAASSSSSSTVGSITCTGRGDGWRHPKSPVGAAPRSLVQPPAACMARANLLRPPSHPWARRRAPHLGPVQRREEAEEAGRRLEPRGRLRLLRLLLGIVGVLIGLGGRRRPALACLGALAPSLGRALLLLALQRRRRRERRGMQAAGMLFRP